MTQNYAKEVNDIFKGKRYLVIGMTDGKVIIMDTQTALIREIQDELVRTLSDKLANAVVNKGGVLEVTDISKTRLASISEGDIFNFSYIVKRYKDKSDKTLGYLAYVFTNKNTVQLVKLDTIGALKLFEHGVVLNAKRVVRDGQEIITGIVTPLPEDIVKTAKTEEEEYFEKERRLRYEDKPDLKETYHKKYLSRVHYSYLGSFTKTGYATKVPTDVDGKKRLERYIKEMLAKNAPDIYKWFAIRPSLKRGVQAVDLYLTTLLLQGKIDMKVTKSKKQAYEQVYKTYDLRKSDIIIIHSPLTHGIKTLDYTPKQVNRDTITIITSSADGVIAVSDSSAIKDTEALNLGMRVGELVVHKLNGVLTPVSETLPVNSAVTTFLHLRDEITLTHSKKALDNLSSEILKYNAISKDAVMVLSNIKLMPDNSTRTNKKKLNRIFSVYTANWTSSDMYNEFGYTIDGKNKHTGLFYSTVDNPLTLKELSKQVNFEIDPELVTCVGDLVILDNLFNLTKEKRKTQAHYGENTRHVLVALLILGNKNLVKDLVFKGLFNNYNIDTLNIKEMPEHVTTAYYTGGRIGDKNNIIEYTSNTIPFYTNGSLREETVDAILDVVREIKPTAEIDREKLRLGAYFV